VVTLLLIRNNVSLDSIPGFGKLSGLVLMIFATLAIMWGLDRMRIYAIAIMPFYYLVLIFIALLAAMRIGWSRVSAGAKK